MLEKPDLPDERITSGLRAAYGIRAEEIRFLPVGADLGAAAYRVTDGNGIYFLKLRKGAFDSYSVELLDTLRKAGIGAIIPPLSALDGKLWTKIEAYSAVLYPFIDGSDGYGVELSEQNWIDFGDAVQRIHSMRVPRALKRRIAREQFSDQWRSILSEQMAQIGVNEGIDPLAAETCAYLRRKAETISWLIERTREHARRVGAKAQTNVLCHADLHAGNVYISEGKLYIVDWDSPILAPRERDLMFPGAGLFGNRRSPREEVELFFRGYGETRLDLQTLAYYRYERIIEDLAVEFRQIFSGAGSLEDRQQAFQWLQSNFEQGGTLELARIADPI